MANIEQLTIQSPTGAALNAYVCMPDQKPRAIIQINHGLVEHAQRYNAFQQDLAAAGFASIAHDHRGHGYTKAEGSALGYFSQKNGEKLVVEDLAAIHDHAHQVWPDVPIIVFGHSFGGFTALNFALSFPNNAIGMAIWNSNFSPGLLGRIGQVLLWFEGLVFGKNTPSKIAPILTFDAWNKSFAPNRTKFDWISSIDSQVDAYIADPLCGFKASTAMWKDLLKLAFRGANDDELKRFPKNMPVFILAGDKDPATNQAQTARDLFKRLQKFGLEQLKLEICTDTRHETLNEHIREKATQMFIEWADTTLNNARV